MSKNHQVQKLNFSNATSETLGMPVSHVVFSELPRFVSTKVLNTKLDKETYCWWNSWPNKWYPQIKSVNLDFEGILDSDIITISHFLFKLKLSMSIVALIAIAILKSHWLEGT